MVLDPRGEVDVSDEQIEVCDNKNQELNSPNQTSREMENSVSTSNSEGGSRPDQSESEERTFVSNLYHFMKDRGTPIERIPHLGFKQINLWKIYKAVETLGGYDAAINSNEVTLKMGPEPWEWEIQVTARRMWKNVYDELGGSPGSTSAATCTRRHYERLVMPFERQLKGEEDKPLPPAKPRKQYKRNPENKGCKPESKKKRKMERDECEEKLGSDHCCDRGMCSHHSQWSTSSDRSDADKSSTSSVHGAHPRVCSRENPLLQSPTPSEVISPLEKKKRMAQASLAVPATIEDGTELERPSVIHLSHSSQSPACPSSTRTRHSSDGSPLPVSSPSSSFSRSPSPYSVSSEDCIAVTSQKSPVKETESKTASRVNTVPTSESSSTGVCKPLSCYPNSKDLANYHRHHYRENLVVGPAHSEKSQKGRAAWSIDGNSAARLAALRLPPPAPYNSKAYWIPHVSSFSKVLPRSDPCRSHQPVFNPHLSYHQHLLKRPTTDDPFMRTMTVASQLTITEKKDKAKTMLPKPLPNQQYFYHPHGSLTVPYLPERPRGDLTEQLKALPLQHVLLPTHLPIPSATHSMHCPPVATSFPGSYDATLPSYPYPLQIWHTPAGYSMAGLQPY